MNLSEIISAVKTTYNADLIIYAGPIRRPWDDYLIEQIGEKKGHDNVLFWLTTYGGNPTAAYRMARVLQKNYSRITVYVNSSCYSAGTLLALGAHAVIIDEHAEFGPIDVQISRKDEIGERISGLTSRSALALATDETPQTFNRIFLKLRGDIGLSTKLAADIACSLTDSTIGKLFQQIDPMRLAEDSRSVKVIENYAERIATDNVRKGAIEALINNYPDHGFVIDPQEAGDKIFVTPETPCKELIQLGKQLKNHFSRYLNESEPAVIFWDNTPTPDEPPTENTHENPIAEPTNEDPAPSEQPSAGQEAEGNSA